MDDPYGFSRVQNQFSQTQFQQWPQQDQFSTMNGAAPTGIYSNSFFISFPSFFYFKKKKNSNINS
jgi:hypothetical protein